MRAHKVQLIKKGVFDAMKENKPDILPMLLDTPAFRTAWNEWKQHRDEKRTKLTSTAIKKALIRLEQMGRDRAIAAINYSISNGWAGIFEAPTQKDGSPIPVPNPEADAERRRLRIDIQAVPYADLQDIKERLYHDPNHDPHHQNRHVMRAVLAEWRKGASV